MYDQDRALIVNAQKGDEECLTKLIEENNGLIWSVVRRFWYRQIEPDDLYQIACIGFIKAVRRFDFDYKVELSTYAVRYIFGEIKKFIRDDGIIKISRQIKEAGFRVKMESINQYIYEDSDCEKQERMTLEKSSNEEDVINKVLISNLLEHLKIREKKIIELRYFKEKTQTEVAGILGISQVQVSRIERRLLRELKQELVRGEAMI